MSCTGSTVNAVGDCNACDEGPATETCLSCRDGGSYSLEGTLTDGAGTHAIAWDSARLCWACCYVAGDGFPVSYEIRCYVSNQYPFEQYLLVDRSWGVGFLDGCPEAGVSCDPTKLRGLALPAGPGHGIETEGFGIPVSDSPTADPLFLSALEADFSAVACPRSLGDVTVSIPRVADEDPCEAPDDVACEPCALPPADLCFEWTNSTLGNGRAVLTYDSVAGTWSYTHPGSSGSQGPSYASSCVDAGGTFAWTTPSNGLTNNGVYTTATTNNAIATNPLKWTGFGFTIPAGSTIKGLKAEVGAKTSDAADTVDSIVKWLQAGTAVGSNLSYLSSGAFPTTLSALTYGGPTSLGGWSPTPADINASSFGFTWSAISDRPAKTISVDYCNVTVWYQFESWLAAVECSEGTITLTVTYGDDAPVSQTLDTSSCRPLDLEFTASGAVASSRGFSGFSVLAGPCDTSCSPCNLPRVTLHANVGGEAPLPPGGTAVPLTYIGSSIWVGSCFALGGDTDVYISVHLSCFEGNAYLLASWSESFPCDTIGAQDNSTLSGHITLDSSTCTPLFLHFTVGVGSPLYALGLREFQVTL